MILNKSNHLILILKFPNQYQIILSEDFTKNESIDSDFIFKDFKKMIQFLQLCLYLTLKVRNNKNEIFSFQLPKPKK